MLKKRVVTALWGVPLLILAVWFDEPLSWFTVLIGVWAVLAVWEFYRITGVTTVAPLAVFGAIWTLMFILSPGLGLPVTWLLASAVVLSLVLLVALPYREDAFNKWAWTMAGVLYVGWLMSFLVALRLGAGAGWVYLAILATFGSDTAAFFAGRAWGRHRMAPRISPGKTWEGAAAGVLGAVVVSLLFTLPTPVKLPLGYGQVILLGVLISVFGQLGDLAESLLKRGTGVKESGTMMPGHGGLLDRMDSVVFTGVLVYFYYYIFIM